jgi:homoserine/homoserine lactone efflux protein
MSHGLAYGVRKTTATIVGLQLGLSVILLVAGMGVGALLLASATAFLVVKVLGAAYLIWLGLSQWRAPVAAEAGDMLLPNAELSVRQRVLRGFLTNVTNPKGIVFMVAVLPQFIDTSRPMAMQLLVLLATSVGVDLVVMHGYAFLASRLQGLLRTVRARRVQNRVFGGVLMAMGASLALVRRGG